MKDIRRFYKELGNLFYAIAVTDNTIGAMEKKKLDDEVQFAWRHYDHSRDRFGTDRAFLIEFEFETMEDQMVPAEDAFRSFEDYFIENKNEIDDLTRKRIFNSAKHIAESFRKINAAEHKYLNRLKQLINT
jgi:superfamily I DNA and/or RNA helicase